VKPRSGVSGRLDLPYAALQFLSCRDVKVYAGLERAVRKAKGDGLSNSLRLFMQQQGKWQTVLCGHEF
jgi:hypothetical protein